MTPSASTRSSIAGSSTPAIVDGAEQRFREAHPLFVAEGEHLEIERQGDAALADFLDGDDAGDNAEIAVIAARVDHRVDVRADEEPLPRAA